MEVALALLTSIEIIAVVKVAAAGTNVPRTKLVRSAYKEFPIANGSSTPKNYGTKLSETSMTKVCVNCQ